MAKRDDIKELYNYPKICERVCLILFVCNVLISVVYVFVFPIVQSILTLFLVFIPIVYLLITLIDDGLLWFKAESERRKNALQKAYGIILSEKDTEGYYNNNFDDPELSYATNVFESLLFTKEISKKMLVCSFSKSIVAFLIFLAACRYVISDDIFLIIAQTVFSTLIVEESLRLLVYSYKMNKLYDQAFNQFITLGITTNEQMIWLRWFCLEYECIKTHYKVRLNESIYNKLNSELSKQWEGMAIQIKSSNQTKKYTQ